MTSKQSFIWCCSECGHSQVKWTGSCQVCRNWNTFTKESEIADKLERFTHKKSQPLRVKEITIEESSRISTQFIELDRLLGGGIVPGSLILVGGDPGIGKSTLMLQLAQKLAEQALTVLYICGEESVEQTSLRALRLKVQDEHVFLLSETLFSHIKLQIERVKPHIMIVDSIQIMYKNEIPSAPGSVSQVRELAMEFMHLAKGLKIATFLVGHVTKSGEIAGPKVLEHIVDTVLDFEGERQQGYRMLRSVKNRFGPTDEIALFQMSVEGLAEVHNPSLLFMEERTKELPGSVIIPALEGSRSLLVEIQALVVPSSFSTSTRKSTGLDSNRLSLLLAVLEKKMGYQLYNCDIFVCIAGGLKISEPAIDLGIIIAIASSFCNKCIDSSVAIVGEVGLGGEVRAVSRIENRIREVIHMGFKQCVIPKRNIKGLPLDLRKKIHLIQVEAVEEVIHELM